MENLNMSTILKTNNNPEFKIFFDGEIVNKNNVVENKEKEKNIEEKNKENKEKELKRFGHTFTLSKKI